MPKPEFKQANASQQNKVEGKQQSKKQDNEVMVEFILRLKDRGGRERELRGFVEEGTARNDAVAKLIRENGGICEIEDGRGELAGLRWISRIELRDGFKIEEWGQYATMGGEFEIGKPKFSLAEKLMAVFFKEFRKKAFWENGDTKRITKNDNAVLFREDYGMKNDLPQADAMLNSRRFGRKGGCAGAITKGELELVKLAARIDFKREEYLVNPDNGKIRKKDPGNDLQYRLPRILAPPESVFFDVAGDGANRRMGCPVLPPSQSSIFAADAVAENMGRAIFQRKFLSSAGLPDETAVACASPGLFFGTYEKEFSNLASEGGEKDGEGNKDGECCADDGQSKEDGDAIPDNEAPLEHEEEAKNKAKKNIKHEHKKHWAKHETGGKEAVQDEKEKILSIIKKLGSDKERESEKSEKIMAGNEMVEEKELAIEEKGKNKKNAVRDKKDGKHGAYGKKQPGKKAAGKKQPEKNNKGKKAHKAEKKPDRVEAKTRPQKPFHKKIKTPNKAASSAPNIKPKEKNKKPRRHHASENKGAGTAKKIKLKKIPAKKNKDWKPQEKNTNPGYKKGAELAHKLFLKALKSMERKKVVDAIVMSGKRRRGGRSSNKKPGNKV